MAEAKKKKRRVVRSETVRERAAKQSDNQKPRRVRRVAAGASRPIKSASDRVKREFHLPMPDNKLGRLMRKRVRFIPRFFRDAWAEVRQVTWPSRRETLKLSLAVFVFAVVFGGLIWIVDYGLSNLFRKVFIE